MDEVLNRLQKIFKQAGLTSEFWHVSGTLTQSLPHYYGSRLKAELAHQPEGLPCAEAGL